MHATVKCYFSFNHRIGFPHSSRNWLRGLVYARMCMCLFVVVWFVSQSYEKRFTHYLLYHHRGIKKYAKYIWNAMDRFCFSVLKKAPLHIRARTFPLTLSHTHALSLSLSFCLTKTGLVFSFEHFQNHKWMISRRLFVTSGQRSKC